MSVGGKEGNVGAREGKNDGQVPEICRGRVVLVGRLGGWEHCALLALLLIMGPEDVLTRHHTDRFPMATAARTAKTGLAIGLAYGLAQDAVGAMRGRRPGYVDFILGSGGKEEGVTT